MAVASHVGNAMLLTIGVNARFVEVCIWCASYIRFFCNGCRDHMVVIGDFSRQAGRFRPDEIGRRCQRVTL
jgi:hypothetical protein